MIRFLRAACIAAVAFISVGSTSWPVAAQIVPPLPVDICIPDRVGTQIDPPGLDMAGVPLVMSNSPETLNGVYTAMALYRTALQVPRFRVFLHHQNSSYKPLKIGIAITNPASAKTSVDLYTGRNSQMLTSERRSTVHTDPAMAGNLALRNWFLSNSSDHYLCTLAPGKTHYILQDVANGSTTTGMYDFGVKLPGKASGKPNVIVTVLACASPPADPTVLTMLQPERFETGLYRRGTFAHSDRIGRVECDASQISWLDIAGPNTGQFARPMANEVESAMEDAYGFNAGNYGVVYSLRLALRNPTSMPIRVRCLLSAAGGRSFSNVLIDGRYCESGKPLCAYGSWVFKEVTVPANQTSESTLEFSLPGGSFGAHRLYIWPDNAPNQPQMQIMEIQL